MKTTNLEDKLTEVLKATEHPEQYTDEQLQELLADEECAEYYRLICDADNAYAEAPEESEEEIEAEWQRITRNSQPSSSDTIQVFQDAELQEILTVVANYYKLHTDYRSEEARHVRLYTKWNKAESAEKMVKRLNRFDKVNLTLEGDVLTVR